MSDGVSVGDRVTAAAALLPVAGGAFLVHRFDPATSALFPPCPFKLLTGLNCPGCGTMRALHQLLTGHPSTAFGLNPLAMLALPLGIYGVAWALSVLLRGRRLPPIKAPAWSTRALPWLVVAWGVLRNAVPAVTR